MEKPNLLISFSGGRTSAFMTWWLLNNMQDQYNMVVVFANTGKEREETLGFVNNCDRFFRFNTVWVEADVQSQKRIGTKAKVVSFSTASRNGEPYEEVIKKYGMPNIAWSHCTRELKQRPIESYCKQIWGQGSYYRAIGIRIDEIDRMNEKRKELKIIYPLISIIPTAKSDVNLFWSKQPFDLQLKSYEGNCDLCFKKSLPKLLTIAKENPQLAEWWKKMEIKYENHTPQSRSQNQNLKQPYRFFRENRGVDDLLNLAQNGFKESKDESKTVNQYSQAELFEFGCKESCEAF